jgi:hypothetical protein
LKEAPPKVGVWVGREKGEAVEGVVEGAVKEVVKDDVVEGAEKEEKEGVEGAVKEVEKGAEKDDVVEGAWKVGVIEDVAGADGAINGEDVGRAEKEEVREGAPNEEEVGVIGTAGVVDILKGEAVEEAVEEAEKVKGLSEV